MAIDAGNSYRIRKKISDSEKSRWNVRISRLLHGNIARFPKILTEIQKYIADSEKSQRNQKTMATLRKVQLKKDKFWLNQEKSG